MTVCVRANSPGYWKNVPRRHARVILAPYGTDSVGFEFKVGVWSVRGRRQRFDYEPDECFAWNNWMIVQLG